MQQEKLVISFSLIPASGENNGNCKRTACGKSSYRSAIDPAGSIVSFKGQDKDRPLVALISTRSLYMIGQWGVSSRVEESQCTCCCQ